MKQEHLIASLIAVGHAALGVVVGLTIYNSLLKPNMPTIFK